MGGGRRLRRRPLARRSSRWTTRRGAHQRPYRVRTGGRGVLLAPGAQVKVSGLPDGGAVSSRRVWAERGPTSLAPRAVGAMTFTYPAPDRGKPCRRAGGRISEKRRCRKPGFRKRVHIGSSAPDKPSEERLSRPSLV